MNMQHVIHRELLWIFKLSCISTKLLFSTEKTLILGDSGQTAEVVLVNNADQSVKYQKRHVGLMGFLGICVVFAELKYPFMFDSHDEWWGWPPIALICIGWFCLGMGFLWIEISDEGGYLLVRSGPWGWSWMGCGKEKIKYSEIRDYSISRMCWFPGPGQCCSGVTIIDLSSPFAHIPCFWTWSFYIMFLFT